MSVKHTTTPWANAYFGAWPFADAVGIGALLLCLAMGAMYKEAPKRQTETASKSHKGDKEQLLPA